jgi:hypothetical protein
MTEELKIYAEPITSLYYVKSKIPNKILNLINEDIDYLLNNKDEFKKWNQYLAGNISEEYKFSGKSYELLEEFVLKIAENYFYVIEDEKLNPYKKYDHFDTFFNKERTYILESLWVNFQKKYEFNPIHSHSGDYSFVIWVRIPYDLQNELNQDNCKNSNQAFNSLFSFSFTSASGDIQSLTLEIDKTWEGVIVMFPSWLMHTVYPFYTSDDYRVSIAGNIYLREEM